MNCPHCGKDIIFNMTKVGGKLKAWRVHNDFTQDEAAVFLGIGRRQLNRWEGDHSKPHPIYMRILKDKGVI